MTSAFKPRGFVLLDPENGKEIKDGVAKPLGRGMHGAVYLAFDQTSLQKVVIKTALESNRAIELTDECNKAKEVTKATNQRRSWTHHIMSCLGAYPDADPPFIVLTYAGKDGLRVVSDDTSFEFNDPRRIHGYLKQMVFALRALNNARPPLIHHDLKWSNVAVNDRRCLQFIDLDSVLNGTRKGCDPKVSKSEWTAHFAPPEFLDGDGSTNFKCSNTEEEEPSDPEDPCPLAYAFDVFSLGIMGAGEICGVPLYMYAAFKKTLPDSLADFEEELQTKFGFGPRRAQHLAGYAWWRDTRKWGGKNVHARETDGAFKLTKDLIKDVLAEEAVALVRTYAPQFSESFQRRRDYCEGLSAGALDSLTSMSHADASKRPRPRHLLKSPLLKGVNSGCSLDYSNGFRIAEYYTIMILIMLSLVVGVVVIRHYKQRKRDMLCSPSSDAGISFSGIEMTPKAAPEACGTSDANYFW